MTGWIVTALGVVLALLVIAVALRFVIPILAGRVFLDRSGMRASALKRARFELHSVAPADGPPATGAPVPGTRPRAPGGRWIRLQATVTPDRGRERAFKLWEPSGIGLVALPATGRVDLQTPEGDARLETRVTLTALFDGNAWVEVGNLRAEAPRVPADKVALGADLDADGVMIDGRTAAPARLVIDAHVPPGVRCVQPFYVTLWLGHPIDVSSMIPATAEPAP